MQEAEQSGFTSEDLQVAVNHCGDTNPVEWLRQEELSFISISLSFCNRESNRIRPSIFWFNSPT
jgi:hypothetical protein